MAKYETTLKGTCESVLSVVEEAVEGSISASCEDSSDYAVEDVKCAVRVYERYSWSGGNRVSLSVTVVEHDGEEVFLSAITSGGSQAMFFKVNTFGEEAFLDEISRAIEAYKEETGQD